jgi:uncharacterized protein YgiM (DUF1202 family)
VACTLGQDGIANRDVNLRRDPSTASPVLELLTKGARVMLEDATADLGFFHVRTEDDQVGWAWSKYITVSPASAPPVKLPNRMPFKVTQTDAKAACDGYTDTLTLPTVGSHVRIVGTYVQDAFHAKWMEIHPVTTITVVP